MPSQFFAAFDIIRALEDEVNEMEDQAARNERSWQDVLKPYGRGVKRVLDVGWKKKSLKVPSPPESFEAKESFKEFLINLSKQPTKPVPKDDYLDDVNWKNLLAFCKAEHFRAKNLVNHVNVKTSKLYHLKTDLAVGSLIWKKTLLGTIKKYRICLNQAILHSINNVPSVPGRTIFFIKKLKKDVLPGKDKKPTGLTADKNFQALVMAACAIKSCQDVDLYYYEAENHFDGDHEDPVSVSRLHFDKKTSSLIDLVNKWKDRETTFARYKNMQTMIDWILFEKQPLTVNRLVFVNERDLPVEYLRTRTDFATNKLRVYSLGDRKGLIRAFNIDSKIFLN